MVPGYLLLVAYQVQPVTKNASYGSSCVAAVNQVGLTKLPVNTYKAYHCRRRYRQWLTPGLKYRPKLSSLPFAQQSVILTSGCRLPYMGPANVLWL